MIRILDDGSIDTYGLFLLIIDVLMLFDEKDDTDVLWRRMCSVEKTKTYLTKSDTHGFEATSDYCRIDELVNRNYHSDIFIRSAVSIECHMLSRGRMLWQRHRNFIVLHTSSFRVVYVFGLNHILVTKKIEVNSFFLFDAPPGWGAISFATHRLVRP